MSGSAGGSPDVLVIEDEPYLRLSLVDHLRDCGYTVLEAADGVSGLELFRARRPSVVTLDLRMSPGDGHETLSAIRELDWDTPVIIISGQGEMSDAIRALRNGAFDYLQKPITDMAILDRAVRRALERDLLRRGNARLSRSFLAESPDSPEDFSDILTLCPRMRDIFRYCEAIAQSGEPVLITGQTGVGKELLARALHRSSGRTGPFLAVNVAGLDEHTFSDSLFGHLRGAFTGAERTREGFIAQAAEGTLFLDEVGELLPQSQIRLLRVLQEREFYPLGSDRSRPLRARILAATNRSVEELRQSADFRRDFFFRLATHTVTLPPLNQRREDIVLLFRHYLAQAAGELGRPVPDLSPGLGEMLCAHDYPGNVRQVKALAYDALARCTSDRLTRECLVGMPPAGDQHASGSPELFTDMPTLPTIRKATEALVEEALRRAGGVQKTAAALLGITPQSLSERLKRR